MTLEEKCTQLLKTDPAFKEKLKCFLVLAKVKFIETAALELKISTADVVRNIQDLEAQLETPLFEDLSEGFMAPQGRA